MNKLVSASIGVLSMFALVASPAFAAAPDGAGPWADQGISLSQGLRKNGSPVIPPRSDISSALGVAENTNANGTFLSLGFGGNVVLKFDNPVSNGVVLVEATNLPYPTETATVELSADGTNWLTAGNVSQDGSVPMPNQLSCARFVRITDTSNKNSFPNDADGYDVDGVRATEGVPCETPDVPEFGAITAVMATLISSGSFVALRSKFNV